MSKAEKKTERNAFYNGVYKVCAHILGWFFRVKAVGKEKVPANGNFIVCANHTSAIDPIALCCALWEHQVKFMAKKELFKVPILAPVIKLFGAFPVDRGGNDVGAIKKAVTIVKEGNSMGIFPQGHRYPEVDPRTTEAKNGASLIAVKAEADVLPVYILRKNNKFRLFRRTLIVVGDLIPFSSLEYDPEAQGEYNRITNVIFDSICSIGENYSKDMRKS